ncbi:MAG: thioredoxin [Clostridia bacterium]|nr:thioredoxin [Clostridia bacterium]
MALLVTRIIVAVVAVTFIALGAVNGGMADVLGKAVRICTECIGLG